MRIYHRLTVDTDIVRSFEKHGIDWRKYCLYSNSEAPFKVLKVYEDSEDWHSIQGVIRNKAVVDIVDTEFSDAEFADADYLEVLSSWFIGFPEPRVNEFGYRTVTFASDGFCEKCGIGLKQAAPFQVAREPKWGKRQTFQLHWVFDELFVKRDAWEQVFKPFGIDGCPVHTRRGVVIESVVQLVVHDTAKLVIPPDHAGRECQVCQRTKYLPFTRGFRPRPHGASKPILKSKQYFGDGGEAYQMLLVDQELFHAMSKANLNCRYWSCA